MPGVVILPSPPQSIPGFGSTYPCGGHLVPSPPQRSSLTLIGVAAMQNGFTRNQEMTTAAEVKEKAKEAVQKEARSASALTLIKIARSQMTLARECELRGDLKGALGALTKAASLANMFMSSAEFQAEKGKGVLRNELVSFMEVSTFSSR